MSIPLELVMAPQLHCRSFWLQTWPHLHTHFLLLHMPHTCMYLRGSYFTHQSNNTSTCTLQLEVRTYKREVWRGGEWLHGHDKRLGEGSTETRHRQLNLMSWRITWPGRYDGGGFFGGRFNVPPTLPRLCVRV